MKRSLGDSIALVAMGVLVTASSALALHKEGHKAGESWKANLLAEFPLADAQPGIANSDVAFWGNLAYVGNYAGFRIFDISGPTPELITDFRCFGPQNDPSVYDVDGDGHADVLFLSVDRTLSGPECGAVAVAHDAVNGWEGIRVFDIRDPRNPKYLTAVYQDCGSHTHTLLPQPERKRLLILNSSYPLRPGPTCGPVNGPAAGRDPLHGVIQVIEVPLGMPVDDPKFVAGIKEIAELPINYPGDPDNKFDPCEHGLCAPFLHSLRACHDISVFVPLGLVAGACAEQAQLWKIDPASGLPDTANPLWVYDDPVDTDGPGGGDVAVDFWHSATFTWDGKVLVFIDESFGRGCPTVTNINGVPSDTGRAFFIDVATGEKLSHFFINRPETDDPVAEYCSSHLGNVVPANGRYLLVNAWYTGGVDVIDFTNPRRPREIAFFDRDGDNWSAYWYEPADGFVTGPMRIYATDGVEGVFATPPQFGEGFQALEMRTGARRRGVPYLNPQTQEFVFP